MNGFFNKKRLATLSFLFLFFLNTPYCSSSALKLLLPNLPSSNWYSPDLGFGTGTYEVSLGTHIWTDLAVARNLRARLSLNLWPGVRAHMQWRSNREFDGIDHFDPFLDEGYLEWLSFLKHPNINFSQSIKLGRLRYLRFPNPDIISMFDLPPGLEDLHSGKPSWFQGLLFTQEYEIKFGLGYHFTRLYWLDPERNGKSVPENYLFYRNQIGWFEIEARLGRLQHRTKPYWRGSHGRSLYSGVRVGDYRVGLFYEDIDDEPIRTGILVEFEPNIFTEFSGNSGLDYTRNPMGIGIQTPLARGYFGFNHTTPQGMIPVGKVEAERTITYFENGQGRNFYEHIISYEGTTESKDSQIVINESPWYLRIESLVSPHNSFKDWNDFVDWEKTRQGPAQLAQKVTYTYYRLPMNHTR